MVRKIKRLIARHNLAMQEISIFGKYAPAKISKFNKRTKKMQEQNSQRSFFARVWRSYL